MNCEPEVIGRLQIGGSDDLPFPDDSFDAVLCINSHHNLPRALSKVALGEIERLAPGKGLFRLTAI